VIRIGERPTAADRHETTVAVLREDHTQKQRALAGPQQVDRSDHGATAS
jgi:hypothetical protein